MKKIAAQKGFAQILPLVVLAVLAIALVVLVAKRNADLGEQSHAATASITLATIYDDALAPNWVDWSWGAKVNYAYKTSTFTGTKAIAVMMNQKWAGLYIHNDTATPYPPTVAIHFALMAGQANQQFGVRIQTSDDNQIGKEVLLQNVGGNPVTYRWKEYTIPISKFTSSTANIGGIIIQDESGKNSQELFVDDIRVVTPILETLVPTPTVQPTLQPTINPTLSPAPTATVKPTPVPTGTPSPITGRVYPMHTNIISTTFWVGEIFNASLSDGSQVCSAYDSEWAYHWSGINAGTVPSSAAGCPGSIVGGCDGVGGYQQCQTEKRTAANNYFPSSVTPKENPFYLDLPFDDLNDATAFAERCQVIPWANDPGYAGHCSDTNFSYMKNRWVKITGPNGHTCYGQNEDAGPSHGNLYHDANYVFGSNNAQPVQGQFNDAGMDVSPALNGCLGFAELDGENDHISWQFVDDADVPAGPWKILVTTSGVTQ